ncbi:Tex family protein [Ructibacterium gallinarum]|uniref:RNA-binding transcriptional accessory protein n=1 Tax=Ructibacterium gallinarum TaxID=2779355 RepID=A0A9D5R7I0_9FIRM|nr:Tex family protein [Ructibacterium gallinarum]MBE5039206.1 RNA-binding transcriptional accessory protein [Ructibacterium gallinarum]
MEIAQQLAAELGLKNWQVEHTIALLDEGNTIPFISRYRKEATGELNDEVLRNLEERLNYLRSMAERKEDIKRLIGEQGKLTEELAAAIDACTVLNELEDIYRPYRPKRKTRATVAKAKGLEPLAQQIYAQEPDFDPETAAEAFVNPEKEVESASDAIAGAMDIIAEQISDNADHRKRIRELTFKTGTVTVKAAGDEDSVYRMYYDFSEPCIKIAPHRTLAIDRGEKEKFLTVSILPDTERILSYIKKKELAKNSAPSTPLVEAAAEDAYSRLIAPSIEREIRNELTETAQEQAIKVFKVNLKNLLMQPPIHNKVVIGLDPGYRTGCKVAVVDGTGKVLDTGVIYVTHSKEQKQAAETYIKDLIKKYDVDLLSIGNGTASKETEMFAAELLKSMPGTKVRYLITNEAGASVYSASKLGAEEFPDFDVTRRSAISIARRVQDPLAELVKIEPKAIGVGQYQHDMNQKRLGEALGGVVEDAVNSVGVDLNTASAPLLNRISGISAAIAKNIVAYREETGVFTDRAQLKKVPKLGPKAFEQCAGFLRIKDGKNVLDNTSVHPESYPAAKALLQKLGYSIEDVKEHHLADLEKNAEKQGIAALAQELSVGEPTLRDIIQELNKPGRDPRDEIEQPILRSDVMQIEDLKEGMILTGTVRNVIDFGAFVDIGVHQDGLVHISQLSDKYVKHPMDVVSIGDIVKVMVLEADPKKKRISLTMKGLDNK